MLYNICYLFLIFISFSFLGWCVETVTCTITERKIILNRGFLIGTYCPIYGTGAVLAIWCLKRYYADPPALFIFAVVGSSVLEYITSYIMEKLFNARWWDYSHMKFNVNGRVVLRNSLLFGIMGLTFIYFINPFYEKILVQMNPNFLQIISIILFLIFLTDCVISFVTISKLKLDIRIMKDSSEEISEQVKIKLRKNRFLKRRLLSAFPKIKTAYGESVIEKVNKILENVEKGIRVSKKKIKQGANITKQKLTRKTKKKGK